MINKYTVKGISYSLVLISTFFLFINVRAQNTQILKELNKYASQKYGTNDLLVNGWKYYPDHFNAAGNPNFNNLDWTNGNLVMRGETFENIDMTYKIEIDELILMKFLKDGSPAFVLLNKTFVESFTIDQHHFVNNSQIETNTDLNGFVELLYSGEFMFLIKHQKNFVANYSSDTPNGSISRQISVNYIFENNILHKITSKKMLLNYFEPFKKKIKKYMKQNNIRYKKATSTQLKKLMEYCDEL